MTATSIPQVIDLEFATLELYDQYVIGKINSGILLDDQKIDVIYNVFKKHYHKPFGYIADRKNDYSVDPFCYKKADGLDNLKGMAIRCYKSSTFKSSLFENQFFSKPLKPFYTHEECVGFIEGLLSQKETDL